MHPSTFEYLQPTAEQVESMGKVRVAAKVFAEVIEGNVREGPDKTYLLRKFREVVMWANVAITRNPDGVPRSD